MYLALRQSCHPTGTRRRGRKVAEFSYRLVVPANHHHVTLFNPVNVTREVGLSFLNIDLYYGAQSDVLPRKLT